MEIVTGLGKDNERYRFQHLFLFSYEKTWLKEKELEEKKDILALAINGFMVVAYTTGISCNAHCFCCTLALFFIFSFTSLSLSLSLCISLPLSSVCSTWISTGFLHRLHQPIFLDNLSPKLHDEFNAVCVYNMNVWKMVVVCFCVRIRSSTECNME